jgi:hypothetical protein
LPGHPKTKKLIRRLGVSGGWHLVRLFLWTAENRSDGDLSGMSDEDIELAVDWEGEEGAFAAALEQVGFFDGQEGARTIHDWEEHNPWAAGSEQRSEKSKWAALCKQYGRQEAARMMPAYAERLGQPAKPAEAAPAPATANPPASIESATGTNLALPDFANGVPLAVSGSAPSPIPSPSPLPSPIPKEKPSLGGKPPDEPRGFADFWRAWPTTDRKQAKGKCLEAWKKAHAERDAAVILAHVDRMKTSESWTKQAGQFVPAPLVYLNQRRWEGAEDLLSSPADAHGSYV